MSVESFPSEPFVDGCQFDLTDDNVAVVRTRGNMVHVHEMVGRIWKAVYQTKSMPRAEVQTWKAFYSALRSGLNQFYGHDPERRFPVTYPTGFAGLSRHAGGSFDGTGTITAISASGLTIATLPSTFAFKKGDLVGLVDGSYRSVHEVKADVTAAAGVAVLTVEPEINTVLFDTGSTFNLDRPKVIMIMEPGSWRAPRGPEGGPISFSASQASF